MAEIWASHGEIHRFVHILGVHVRLAALLSLVIVSPATAQTNGPGARSSRTPSRGFLTNYEFHLNATRFVSSRDEQFNWDTDIGADIDLVDLGFGRFSFFANLESILGEEFQAFDPNQSNYTLDTSVWFRLRRAELGATLHHVSRHLGDRSNRISIAWNMVGIECATPFSFGPYEMTSRLRAVKTIGRSSVDYKGEIGTFVDLIRPLDDRVAIIMSLGGTVVPVDGSLARRDTVAGGHVEVGLRISGTSGAMELFVGRERRIDADPIERRLTHWTQIGFRVLSR
jgi:hypothetical protein